MKGKNYVLGIIGGLIGGFIASIPWILMYVYGNMILSLLAILIALGALKGYQIFKGKEDKNLPIFIIIISVIVVTIATLIIIPKLLIIKDGNSITLTDLYNNSEFKTAIIKDYIISLIFTGLGISGVISSIKNKVNNENKANEGSKVYRSVNKLTYKLYENEFKKYNATSKNNLIDKETILNNINLIDKDDIFKSLIYQDAIKEVDGKYYFAKKIHQNYTMLIIIIVLIVAIMVGAILFFDNNKDYNKIIKNNITYEIPSNWKEYDDETLKNKFYYVPDFDESGYSGVISVTYYKTTYTINDYEEMKNQIYDMLKEDEYEPTETKVFTLENGYKVFEIDYLEDKVEDKLYYVFTDNNYALVYSTNFFNEKVTNIDEITKNIINSISFK